ncbi:MAG: 5'-methylthioadenosine/S-adenosylhomocysteine nucleosidase [Clostridia bacterium]|nr:5'-methylthioadenosine/S-adenosylhomocysteine nucleosidase [Clostridia bacterium]
MLGIVVALKKEADSFLSSSTIIKEYDIGEKKIFEGKFSGYDFALIISGIGKVSAGIATQIIIDRYSPSYIINFGSAGGTEDLFTKTIYLIEKACQYDFDITAIDDVPIGFIQEYGCVYFNTYTNGLNFLPKKNLASGDSFVGTKEKVDIIKSLQCSIFDMEGCAVAQTSKTNGIPVIILKGVSDVFGSGSNSEQFLANLKEVSDSFPKILKQVFEKIL